MYTCDMHTHTIASGHGSSSTIADMAKAAKKKGLRLLGITDHGPATPAAGTPSYFRSLIRSSRIRCGMRLCYGVETNILDFSGNIDMDDGLLEGLDYAIASIHRQNLEPGSRTANTLAYTQAMRHPKVKIIGHPDDTRYPLDYETLAAAAKEYGVILEVNNSSLSPDGYRGDVHDNYTAMLHACLKYRLPVLLSSDSHRTVHIGDFTWAERMVQEVCYPQELILNDKPDQLLELLGVGEPDLKIPRYKGFI